MLDWPCFCLYELLWDDFDNISSADEWCMEELNMIIDNMSLWWQANIDFALLLVVR